MFVVRETSMEESSGKSDSNCDHQEFWLRNFFVLTFSFVLAMPSLAETLEPESPANHVKRPPDDGILVVGG